MWLDRLGANAPPSTFDSRPNSPLPRRQAPGRGVNSPYPTSQPRPNRSSTASLASSSDTGSTTSLLRGASYRGANGGAGGSSLKQTHTIDDGTESLGVLGRILGDETIAARADGNAPPEPPWAQTSIITEEDMEGTFDFGGLSLQQFVARGDAGEARGHIYRPQTVEECMSTTSLSRPPTSSVSICTVKLTMCRDRRMRQSPIRESPPLDSRLRRCADLCRNEPYLLPERPGGCLCRYRIFAGALDRLERAT